MTKILAENALLPTGWNARVLVDVGDDGLISKAEPLSPDATATVDHHVAVLAPAPVNVHSHSFQRAMAGLAEHREAGDSRDFWSWRRLMYRFLERLTPEHVEAIAAQVQVEMLEAGYATNVEFHYLHHQPDGSSYDNSAELSERIAAATHQTGIGVTLLPVLYQHGGCDRMPLTDGQLRFGNDLDQYVRLHGEATKAIKQLPDDCCMGVAPHSLRAVSPEALKRLAEWSKGMPIHMHLAEQQAEVDEVFQATGSRPTQWLLDNVAIDARWCLIHCTQMQLRETSQLAKTGAVAGLCPITESNLGDGVFDGRGWFEAGGSIAIGSDSNVRISLSEELRTLDYSQRLRDRCRVPFATERASSGRALFDAVLSGGAQAAQRATGSIEAGYYADLLSLESDGVQFIGRTGDQVLDTFIFAGDDSLVQDVWSAGRHLVRQGRHVHRDSVAERFGAAMRELQA